MAVRPDPLIPSVTCSDVDDAENPDDPFLPKIHMLVLVCNRLLRNGCIYQYFFLTLLINRGKQGGCYML